MGMITLVLVLHTPRGYYLPLPTSSELFFNAPGTILVVHALLCIEGITRREVIFWK
jgi:hypothetical protein